MKRETPPADVSLVPMTTEMYHAYFREFENDPELYADKSRWEHYVYSPEKVDSYIERQKEKHRLSFAIMEGSELAGEIVIKDITDRESASFGVCMKNDGFKNRGLGTQAEKLALDFIFNDLDIPTVYADALLKNKRSRRVLEKLGFESLSEDENFVYYRKEREEKTAEPGSSLSREEV